MNYIADMHDRWTSHLDIKFILITRRFASRWDGYDMATRVSGWTMQGIRCDSGKHWLTTADSSTATTAIELRCARELGWCDNRLERSASLNQLVATLVKTQQRLVTWTGSDGPTIGRYSMSIFLTCNDMCCLCRVLPLPPGIGRWSWASVRDSSSDIGLTFSSFLWTGVLPVDSSWLMGVGLPDAPLPDIRRKRSRAPHDVERLRGDTESAELRVSTGHGAWLPLPFLCLIMSWLTLSEWLRGRNRLRSPFFSGQSACTGDIAAESLVMGGTSPDLLRERLKLNSVFFRPAEPERPLKSLLLFSNLCSPSSSAKPGSANALKSWNI